MKGLLNQLLAEKSINVLSILGSFAIDVFVVFSDRPDSMNNARHPAQDCQQNIDQKRRANSVGEKNSQGWDYKTNNQSSQLHYSSLRYLSQSWIPACQILQLKRLCHQSDLSLYLYWW
jgi:hypothetical protein